MNFAAVGDTESLNDALPAGAREKKSAESKCLIKTTTKVNERLFRSITFCTETYLPSFLLHDGTIFWSNILPSFCGFDYVYAFLKLQSKQFSIIFIISRAT